MRTGYAAPIVPDEVPEDDAALCKNRRTPSRTNEIVKGKFLSDDGTLALIVISLDREVVQEHRRAR